VTSFLSSSRNLFFFAEILYETNQAIQDPDSRFGGPILFLQPGAKPFSSPAYTGPRTGRGCASADFSTGRSACLPARQGH
jgi:hypothetical protein